MITTQKMHFYKLKLNCTKHFWVVVRPFFYPNWHIKDLANVTNRFLVSFSVFGSFSITKTGQDWGRVLCKLWQGKLKINHMKNPSFGALQNPLPNLKRIGKAISSKMEENRAFHKAKTLISQGVPKFGKVCQTFAGCAKISQGMRKSLCAHQPSRFFSRIVIFPFYYFCNR